jgi:hypothetical protein
LKRKKLRQLAKEINYGKEVNIKFIFAPADTFCYNSEDNTLEISSFFYQLPHNELITSLVHEIGHMNTTKDCLLMSTYTAEYEANRWALFRLDEMDWQDTVGWYKIYLYDLAFMSITDEDDEEYQEAATELLQELEII